MPPQKYRENREAHDWGQGPANLRDVQIDVVRSVPVVDSFKYLGSIIASDGKSGPDVQNRIKRASSAYGALAEVIFKASNISITSKKKVYTSFILSTLLYGSESWSITAELMQKLRVFHNMCVRRICDVNRRQQWLRRITSQMLLARQ